MTLQHTKLDRIRHSIKEVKLQMDKYPEGTTRRNDWQRELQRLKNVEYKLVQHGLTDDWGIDTQASCDCDNNEGK